MIQELKRPFHVLVMNNPFIFREKKRAESGRRSRRMDEMGEGWRRKARRGFKLTEGLEQIDTSGEFQRQEQHEPLYQFNSVQSPGSWTPVPVRVSAGRCLLLICFFRGPDITYGRRARLPPFKPTN